MKRLIIISIGLMLSGWFASHAQAAQPAVEDFSSGANGWAGTSELLTGTWTFTGGAARAVFSNTGGFPFPDICTLSNTPTASSGSFTGNYEAAGIDAIGFSFLAPSALPASSAVELEWAGSTSVYRRGFSVTQTGVWYHFSASLKVEDKGSWTVIAGSLENFAAARQSVRRVAFRVARTLTVAHQFVFDDIFIAGQPGGASITGGDLVWDGLVAGVGYQVQSTTNLVSSAWMEVETLTATGFLHTTVITNTTRSSEAFRILFE